MIEERELDIWKLESQEKVRKMAEEWYASLLGERLKRMMQNADQSAPPETETIAANATAGG